MTEEKLFCPSCKRLARSELFRGPAVGLCSSCQGPIDEVYTTYYPSCSCEAGLTLGASHITYQKDVEE